MPARALISGFALLAIASIARADTIEGAVPLIDPRPSSPLRLAFRPASPPDGSFSREHLERVLCGDGSTAIASMSEGGAGPLAYYAYKRINDRWNRLEPATAPLGRFAVSGNTVIAGHPEHGGTENNPGPGIAYIYAVPEAVVPEAPTLQGSVSGNTVSLNWTASPTGSPATSFVVEAGQPGAKRA